MSPDSQPYVLAPGEGPVCWTLDLPGRAKATSEQTSGTYRIVEARCAPSYATPLHIHYLENEAIYVLEGHLSVVCGGATARAVPGSYLFLPRGIAHGFRVTGDAPARILCLTTPAGPEQTCPPVSAAGPALPVAAVGELETLADLAAQYKIDVLGPLPTPTTKTRHSA